MRKDPNAVLDYRWDWAGDDPGPWLAEGETITSATFTVTPDGLTKGAETHTDSTATVWLSAGTVGTRYLVTCRIVTNQGRTDDRTKSITVTER